MNLFVEPPQLVSLSLELAMPMHVCYILYQVVINGLPSQMEEAPFFYGA